MNISSIVKLLENKHEVLYQKYLLLRQRQINYYNLNNTHKGDKLDDKLYELEKNMFKLDYELSYLKPMVKKIKKKRRAV